MLPSLYRKDHTGPICNYWRLRLNKQMCRISKFIPSKSEQQTGRQRRRCHQQVRDSKVKSKLAAWPQRKGPKQAKQNKTEQRKNYWKADSRSEKHRSLRLLHLGTTSPSFQLQRCLPCSSSEFWRPQRVSITAAREWQGGVGHRDNGKALGSVPLRMPPATNAALLHSALPHKASLIKGLCWFKKNFFN